MKKRTVAVVCLLFFILANACMKRPGDPIVLDDAPVIADTTFTNPILPGGPDPWVVQKDGMYYYTYTQGGKLVLYGTRNLSELASATRKDAWVPPSGTPYSKNLWAPELHQINGKWYFYFAADNGSNANHRMYVVENSAADPMEGSWMMKGKVADSTDQWAIDGTILQYKGTLYMLWSGGNAGAPPQSLYIAKMSNPWTITGEKVKISTPDYSWEKNGNAINEGPQVLRGPGGRVFIVYSASGYWVDGYCLGLLSLEANGDPLNPEDWTKTPQPVFSMKAESGAYGPGHNGFFKSPDGTEDWIIYHARSLPNGGSNNGRNPRIQKFTWNADGTPNFGEPVKINEPVRKPSGETVRFQYVKDDWSIAGFSSEEQNNSRLAIRLIDNDLTTYWITRYSTNPTNYPDHWITVDMSKSLWVDGFTISQKAGDRKIKELEILVSDDNGSWEPLGLFTLNNIDRTRQYLTLPSRKRFRYFKLRPVSGYDAQPQPGLAEVSAFIKRKND
ncbi:family 43 glycosylhydrolase [Niabella beijingensis]|uniref:family 43 glycosylhydrolase n=1 Tax=Niabella beijingensis TaxID=2872700 RepID=UPI001CBE30A6|nr:family 43 glycosylhydrolase [Niabella beijingensis]MBZ4190410.1 family 43 glycosylhydrolase [Niabella beijingensis]